MTTVAYNFLLNERFSFSFKKNFYFYSLVFSRGWGFCLDDIPQKKGLKRLDPGTRLRTRALVTWSRSACSQTDCLLVGACDCVCLSSIKK